MSLSPSTSTPKVSAKITPYSQPRVLFIPFNPGLADSVESEIRHILADLYMPTRYTTPVIEKEKGRLRISAVSLYSAIEIMARCRTIQDVRVQIFADYCAYKKNFTKHCMHFNWTEWLPAQAQVKIITRSAASKLFHEGMLRQMLTDVLAAKGYTVIPTDEATALTTIHAEIVHDQLSLSLSLAGNSLYQRGFREIGHNVAPLREDLAQACLTKALDFSQKHCPDFRPQTLLVPFGGSGTLIFEYLLQAMNIAPVLLRHSYSLNQLPIFNDKHFSFILRQVAQKTRPCALEHVLYIDHATKACVDFQKNIANLSAHASEYAPQLAADIARLTIETRHSDFLRLDHFTLRAGDVLIPLNPPYGLRLTGQHEPKEFYKRIALRLKHLQKQLAAAGRLGGFILCPNEETWGAFLHTLRPNEHDTYHVSQGGQDLRVCQFLLRKN